MTRMTRRKAIGLVTAGAGLALSGLPGTGASVQQPVGEEAGALALLGSNGVDGRDYRMRIEGIIPDALRGSLYRNGPGMFERRGYRKRNVLDGDGLVQRVSFDEQGARYQNAFVQTPKFIAEQAADRFTHSTWTTRAPGGPLSNIGGGKMASQAGVTIYEFAGRLFALDEVAPIYELDPVTLETIAEHDPGDADLPFANKAHTKIDPANGEWIIAGGVFGRQQKLHVVVRNPDGSIKSHRVVAEVDNHYVHDFFVTQTKVIFVLHPVIMNPLGFMMGTQSFTQALRWQPERGNRILVVNRDGEPDPVWLEADSAFMWHAVNAYDREDGRIVMDFPGYDNPDHFIGEDPQLNALMQGRLGQSANPGSLRRYVLDLATRRVDHQTLDGGHHEFPTIDPLAIGREHRYGYLAAFGAGGITRGIKRFDYQTGRSESFDFGPGVTVGEPIFARAPDSWEETGWLIQQGLAADTERSFFAIFRSDAVGDGPVAIAHAEHHIPISFHGCWSAA
jgi:all-trans-8'-apo-beta-carotenal 15,15'-oxygenase